MVKKVNMWSWHNGCDAASQLAKALGIKKILKTGSTFVGHPDTVIINWGSSKPSPEVLKCKIINKPEAVKRSINKLSFFQTVGDQARTVPWTTSKAEVLDWNTKTVCRTKLEGREGDGIELYTPPECVGSAPVGIWGWLATHLPKSLDGLKTSNLGLPEAKLYTQFIKAQEEYRVHVIDGEISAVHRKVQKDGATGGSDVRNTANGWLFKRVNHYPGDCARQAVKAVAALGLDFAAVDVLWDGSLAWVLETNTGPGINGMTWTIEQYRAGIQKLIDKT